MWFLLNRLIMSAYCFHYFCRVSHRHAVWRDVVGDDGACTNHTVVPDGHSRHDAAVLADVYISTNLDGAFGVQRTMTRREVQLLEGHIAVRVVCDIDTLPHRGPFPYLYPVDATDATKRGQNDIVAYNNLRSKRL